MWFNWGGGGGGESGTYGEQREGVQSLAGDDCYEFHFAEKGNFGGREAGRERERHRGCVFIEPPVLQLVVLFIVVW